MALLPHSSSCRLSSLSLAAGLWSQHSAGIGRMIFTRNTVSI